LFFLQNVPAFGRITTILLRIGEPSSGTKGVLVIEKFRIGKALHFNLQMSVLVEEQETPHLVIPSLSLQFVVNMQHDCRACNCDASGISQQMQERQVTDKIICRIVINTTRLHDAALFRKFLPVALTKPRPLFLDRQACHDELAITLAAQQGHKRATTKAKAAATRQKNKAKKEAREPLADHHTPNNESDEGEDPPCARKRLCEE
ncbi:hypothetical protein B0H10DRAFT_1800295, partial [Mycena sp. CBHHK59/15]